MSNTRAVAPSGLQVAHAAAFSLGLLALVVGVFINQPIWYLIAGPCLTLSGGLILVGLRVTFAGPAGEMLRAALGASQVRRISVRAVFWVLAGLLITIWGVERMRAQRNSEPPLQEPLVLMRTD